jgi:hypothetical protein
MLNGMNSSDPQKHAGDRIKDAKGRPQESMPKHPMKNLILITEATGI